MSETIVSAQPAGRPAAVVPTPLPALVNYVREGRCLLFVGAGLSAAAGFPMWRSLLQAIVDETCAEGADAEEGSELRTLLEQGKLLEVADHCRERLGKPRFAELLKARLGRPVTDVPAAHQVIVRLPFAAVVTTNFDKLLETAYGRLSPKGIPRAPTHVRLDQQGTLLFDRGFFVLKAHGDIDDPANLVFTASDYRELIHGNRAFNSVFSALLMTHAVLFVGYSLSDPDFRLLLDSQLTTFGENIPGRYALMSGVGVVERRVLQRTAQIRVLPYDDPTHGAVVEFLRRLEQRVLADGGARDVVPAPAAAPPVAPPSDATGAPPRRPPSAAPGHEAPATAAGPPARPPAEPRPSPTLPALPTRPTSLPTVTLALVGRGDALEAELRGGQEIARGAVQPLRTGALGENMERAIRVTAEQMEHGGRALADALPPAVRAALATTDGETVVRLELPPSAEALPWEWLWLGSEPLCMRSPVVRAPTALPDEARGYPKVHMPLRALLIGDTMAESDARLPLASAREEVHAIAALLERHHAAESPTMLLGREATLARVTRELETGAYDLVHYAGHASFDDRESQLALHDGQVWASEVRSSFTRRPPALVFLNSHFTAFVPAGVTQADAGQPHAAPLPLGAAARPARGFAQAAVAAGVGTFVGCFGTPTDTAAMDVGVTFVRALLEGEPAARALHVARTAHRSDDDVTALLYAMTGYAELRLR